MDTAIDKNQIATLYEWPRIKKVAYVGAILMSMFANCGNSYVLSTLGPKMAEQWGQMGTYALVFTVMMFVQLILQPACAQLSQKFGLGNCLLVAYGSLMLGCLLTALAVNMEMVLIARAVCAVQSAFVMSVGMGAYPLMFEKAECAKWNSFFGTTMSVALVALPTTAGLLYDAAGTYAVPFGLTAAAALIALVLGIYAKPPRHTDLKSESSFDLSGYLTLVVALFCLVYLLSFGGSKFPWISIVSIALVVIAAACAFGFFNIEKKKGDAALLPLRLFKHRGFVVALLAGIFISIPDQIMVVYLPSYAQLALGQSATIGGLFSSVPGLLAVFTSTAFGILLSKKGCFKSLFAFSGALACVACLGLSTFDPSTNIYFIIAFMTATWGLSYSVFKFIPTALGQAYVPAKDSPVCTTMVGLGITLGCTFGTALANIPMGMFTDMVLVFKVLFSISAVGAALATLVVVFGLKKGMTTNNDAE